MYYAASLKSELCFPFLSTTNVQYFNYNYSDLSAEIYSGIWVRRTLNPVYGMADRRVFMLGSRSLLLDKRRQASRRSFKAGILTSRKVYSEESEWKSESSYWLMKSEDNGCPCGVCECEWCSDGCPVGAKN
ncbi:uncharacterized protein TNCV_3815191 [Trichonephila clavipes]|nr:uncharacterized protein TNCV_3815191 [Trichonephila clavipes]